MKTIKNKEDIKLMVDKLDPYELRIVKQLIDSLTSKKTPTAARRKPTKKYYTEVIDLLYRDWETDRKSTRLNSSH